MRHTIKYQAQLSIGMPNCYGKQMQKCGNDGYKDKGYESYDVCLKEEFEKSCD